MAATLDDIKDQLYGLDLVLTAIPEDERPGAYFLHSQWFYDVDLEPADAEFAALRLAAIAAKHGLHVSAGAAQ